MAFLPTNWIDAVLEQIKKPERLDDVLNLLGTQIQALGLADIYFINLLDASGSKLVSLKIQYTPEFKNLEQTFLGKKVALDDDLLAARVYHRRETIRVTAANATEGEAHVLDYWKAEEIVGVPIGDPLKKDAAPIGIIILLRQQKPVEEAALQQLQDLFDLFYRDLAHWLRFTHLEELHNEALAAIDENKRLLQFLDEMNSLTLVDKIYELFAAELFRQLPFDLAAFSLVDGEQLVISKVIAATPQFEPVCRKWQQFLEKNPVSLDPSFSGSVFVLTRDESLLFPDVQTIRHLPMSAHDTKSMEIIATPRTMFMSPIRYRKKPIGIFSLYSLTKTIPVSEADQHLLGHLASFLGTAITNSKIYATSQTQNLEIGHLNEMLHAKIKELAEQASTDQLTGLFNFRTFKQELDKRLAETQRNSIKTSLALLMIDIDHFKIFNDSHGHAAGNDILAGVARDIEKHIRQTDMACRYGGEEFVVILPKCDLEGAKLLAERIRGSIAATAFDTCAGKQAITVSIGCTADLPDDTQQSLFSRADEALYKAKHQGRNQVCIS